MINKKKKYANGLMVLMTAGVTALFAPAVMATSISNGDFTGLANAIPGVGYETLYNNDSTGLTDWTVGPGSIDVVTTPYFTQPTGYTGNDIDLDGSSPGSIFQSLSGLSIGSTYLVTFDLAANTNGTPETKDLLVGVSGPPVSANNYLVSSTYSAELGKWETGVTFSFKATSATETLTFASLDTPPAADGYNGPVIANVAISSGVSASTPLPASAGVGFSMLGLFGGLAVLRKRLFLNNKIA